MPTTGSGAPALRGRALAWRAGRLVLWCEGAVRVLEGVTGEPCRAGDLVTVCRGCGTWRVEVIRPHPRGDFPPAGGDGARFLDEDGALWARLARRAELLEATRRFFSDAGFLEVETPLVVESPGTETHLEAARVSIEEAPGRGPSERFLITSPEYHMKRLLAAGAPPIYQICKVFRGGERGRHHRPEFTMIEWYRPFSGYEALMTDCERWLRGLAGAESIVYQGRTIDLSPPWRRLTFFDALRERAGVVEPERLTALEQERVLLDRVEPTLGEGRPELLIEYPIAMASLARPKPGAPEVAERCELFIAGLELGNGFGELTDAGEQRRRCEAERAERAERGLPDHPRDEAFLGALEEGLPPSAGIAVGFDRVVMLLTDAREIDQVLAF